MQAFHGLILSGRDFGALSRRLAFRRGCALSAAAAILSEEAEEGIHLVELGGVDHRPAFAAHGYKPGRPEPIKVKSQGIRGEVEGGSDGPRWHALGAGLHKEAEYIKPTVLSEGGQRRDDIRLFHISTNIEMTSTRQALFRCLLKCYCDRLLNLLLEFRSFR